MGERDFTIKQGCSIDRRSFLKISGVTGLGLASGGIIPNTARAFKSNNKSRKISGTRLAMGTSVSMTLIYPSTEKAEKALEMAYEEIDILSGLMNRFDNRSPIARLNKEGRLADAHPDIIEVVAGAIKYFRLTNGAFDISIKPVIDLFKKSFSREKNKYPSEKEIKDALDLVGSDMIELKGRDIRFRKKGMGITLDGIAKGYIVDRASKILLSHNIENHLINAGGDIKATGVRLDGKPWTVAVQDPAKRNNSLDIIYLTDTAIATSGNYENYFDREKMFHHIVNPKTGLSPIINVSASVIAPTAMEADILATTLLLMNPEQGAGFIDSLPQCESLVISRGHRKKMSAGWKSVAR
ncbi:FAD:protein FMN transferase [Thermodesulfobacteriota bacterium]